MRDEALAVPGGTLYIRETGDGKPVLLLHAGVTDLRVWAATAPALADTGYRVIRYDCRGMGRSPASEVPFSHVADALAILDAVGVDAAHFVGLSQGAATSVDVALAEPTRVRTLTLIAPGLSGFEWPRLPGYERRLAAAERDDAAELAREIARLWAPMSFSRAADGDFASQVVCDQAAAFMADELEVEEPDARPRLHEITAPTLVVLGDQDVEAITQIGTLLASAIPGARLVTLDGADHMLPLRVPDQLHKLLVHHLSGSAVPTPGEG